MKKVILYNPHAVFFDMPLALLAIGSNLDRSKYEPIIIDGRTLDDPILEIKKHINEAVCFAVTCLTGAPLKNAMMVSEAVKKISPTTPIVWGGWHTSLFPEQVLSDLDYVDITVQGQGEITFSELVNALDSKEELDSISGIAFRGQDRKIRKNKPRVITEIDQLAFPDYSLIDVPTYFKKKNRKQFDFITSAGCFFRCTFCADPFVFSRKFTSLSPDNVVKQLFKWQDEFGFEDVNFQDETFFTYRKDILRMAELIVESGREFTWAATMRADQGSRMSFDDFELLKKSGLRRLLIGVESGSQEMMDWLKKDIKMEQVWLCADRCKALDINVIFPFIVGFPGETSESVNKSISMIKKLRKMSSGFETPIFYFKPYPGSTITQDVVKNGYELPSTTHEWAEFDYIGSHGPWVDQAKFKKIENLKFYLKLATRKVPILLRPIQSVSKYRVKNNSYIFPIEKVVFKTIYKEKKLS